MRETGCQGLYSHQPGQDRRACFETPASGRLLSMRRGMQSPGKASPFRRTPPFLMLRRPRSFRLEARRPALWIAVPSPRPYPPGLAPRTHPGASGPETMDARITSGQGDATPAARG
jgi:hypothetical protein